MHNRETTNDFDRLAEMIAAKWFNGTLPRCPSLIVETILIVVIPDLDLPETIPVSVQEEAKKRFADALFVAWSERIEAQLAAQSQFAN